MKNLMLTTAMVAVTTMGAVAQTADAPAQAPAATAQTGAQPRTVPGFMASDLFDKELYTLDSEDARAMRDSQAAEGEQVRREDSATFNENRDSWENVGNVSDIVVTQDGEVRGVLIDVGGFLGLGARTVMVEMDELNFVTEDPAAVAGDRYSLVVTMSQDELEALPEWDEARLSGFEPRDPGLVQDQARIAQGSVPVEPDATRPVENDRVVQDTTGYAELPAQERTVERLMGAPAYSPQGEDIGSVEELVLDADGRTTHLVMDVGGFLGMGTHTVALDMDQVNIMWNAEEEDVRVQVPMSEDELRAMPEYQDG